MARIDVSPDAVRAAALQLRAILGQTQAPGRPADRSAECLPIEGKCSLRYYPPPGEPTSRPLLLVYALVSRPQVLDLGPGDSFIKRLQDLGHPVYLVDWGSPNAVDAGVSLADYVCGYLRAAARLVRQRHTTRTIDLLGICQGGGLALCLASIEPKHFNRLVTLATAVDFHTAGDVLTRVAQGLDLPALLAPDGNVPGRLVQGMFERLRCLRTAAVERSPLPALLYGSDDERERVLRLLAWQGDYPDQAGPAWLEWVAACYGENQLAKGTLKLGGEVVDLRRLKIPVMNIYARDDHLVPVAATRALGQLLGTRRYVELEMPCGHLGVFAGRRGLAMLPPRLSAFLRGRSRVKAA